MHPFVKRIVSATPWAVEWLLVGGYLGTGFFFATKLYEGIERKNQLEIEVNGLKTEVYELKTKEIENRAKELK